MDFGVLFLEVNFVCMYGGVGVVDLLVVVVVWNGIVVEVSIVVFFVGLVIMWLSIEYWMGFVLLLMVVVV